MMSLPVWLPGPMYLVPCSFQRVSLQEGGLCLGVSVKGASVKGEGVSVKGVSVKGGSVNGSLCERGGICEGGSL